MRLSRRSLIMSAAALTAPTVLRLPSARAADVSLRLHHFLPPKSNVHTRLLDPWAKKVGELSGGKAVIEIFPSMQLGGKPPELYDQAKDGVVDIVWTLPGYTPGRFPRTEVFELPFIASPRGIVNSQASQEYANTHLGEETKDVKLLAFWSHDRGVIHCREKIETLADLQGKKLRFPTRLAGEALKTVGVAAIGMPVPQVPESLAQGVIDGAVVPWEVVPAVKLQELVKFHTEIPGTPTFYTASFFLVMNQARYEGLPEDVRKVIDETTGMTFATEAGTVWDTAGADVAKMVKERGNTILTLSEADKAQWMTASEPVTAAWIAEMQGKGIDAPALIDSAKSLLKKYEAA
ncbi:MAG TPA: TRAP transporter substrate-binding protein [Verrucomicrobiae bacterium]|nr:TRAP transporter substrate-binding protein [Verrucomicrobiae bacterium]